MTRLLALALFLAAAGCDGAAPDEPVAYAAAEVPPVPVGGWAAVAAATAYPDFARRAGVQGTVVTEFVVARRGAADDVQATASPSDLLSEAAIRTLTSTTFEPGRLGGEPVAVRVTACTTFALGATTEITAGPCDR